MNTLIRLAKKCKGDVTLKINEHRSMYRSVKEEIEILRLLGADEEDLPTDIANKMIEKDIIIDVTFYPDTMVGFFRILHWDMNEVERQVNEWLEENK